MQNFLFGAIISSTDWRGRQRVAARPSHRFGCTWFVRASKSSQPQPDPVDMFHDRARRFNWNQSIALGVIRTSSFGSAEIGRCARPRTSPEEASAVGGWFAGEWMSESFWTQNLSVRAVHWLSNGVQHDGTLCAVSGEFIHSIFDTWHQFVTRRQGIFRL